MPAGFHPGKWVPTGLPAESIGAGAGFWAAIAPAGRGGGAPAARGAPAAGRGGAAGAPAQGAGRGAPPPGGQAAPPPVVDPLVSPYSHKVITDVTLNKSIWLARWE